MSGDGRSEPPGAYISPAEMYEHLQRLATVVIGIDAKMDALAYKTERLGDHEERLRLLEARRLPAYVLSWLSFTVAAVIGVLSVTRGGS